MIIINKPLLCLLGLVAVVGTFTTVMSFEGKREVFSEAGAIQIEDDTKQIVSVPQPEKNGDQGTPSGYLFLRRIVNCLSL